ncbi:MAG: hypothetical protein NC347_05730 [Clostridium sp.]|nr:hypothetical protein [Clostridium sp.]
MERYAILYNGKLRKQHFAITRPFNDWLGGYGICSVLAYHPEVEAVIECSGAGLQKGG